MEPHRTEPLSTAPTDAVVEVPQPGQEWRERFGQGEIHEEQSMTLPKGRGCRYRSSNDWVVMVGWGTKDSRRLQHAVDWIARLLARVASARTHGPWCTCGAGPLGSRVSVHCALGAIAMNAGTKCVYV